MKSATKLDGVDPNMEFNSTLVDKLTEIYLEMEGRSPPDPLTLPFQTLPWLGLCLKPLKPLMNKRQVLNLMYYYTLLSSYSLRCSMKK